MRPADTTQALSNEPLKSLTSGSNCQNRPARADSALLIDQDAMHSQCLIECLAALGLSVELCSTVQRGKIKLSGRDSQFELVVLNVSDASKPWNQFLHVLSETFINSGRAYGPKYLCVSTVQRDFTFVLEIEDMGARYVYER